MKILFLCSSVEPGKDGVGDYSLKIAAELSDKGYLSCILSFHDRYTQLPYSGLSQGGTDTLRLPSSLPNKERKRRAKEWIAQQNPDVISIQYVPYGFHRKGLPFWLPGVIREFSGGRKVHIMFHELWQGESKESTLKEKMIGFLQIRIAKNLFSQPGFVYAFTNTDFYSRCLSREAIPNQLVPVFSNLPSASGSAVLYNCLPDHIRLRRDDYIIACFFGAIHFHSGLGQKIAALSSMVDALGKKLVVVQVGKADIGSAFLDIFTSEQMELVQFGPQDASVIPDLFARADIGLSTYPKILYQKSGSMAALLANGLPVVILRNGFEKDNRQVNEVKEIEEIVSLRDFILQPKTFASRYAADYTTDHYISLLNSIRQDATLLA